MGKWQAGPANYHPGVTVETRSVLTCPACGVTADETMPVDACVYYYECRGCRTLLKPKPGDCCVFCSFGTVKCPPVQEAGACCGSRPQ